jgi:urea carboxylase
MPIILGPDGPSLGGFVCPATIIEADLWKVGQLKADDTVRFVPVSLVEARRRLQAQQRAIETLRPDATYAFAGARPAASPLLATRAESPGRPAVVIRQDGDANVLVEYGAAVLDLGLRFRVHALMQAVAARRLPGVVDVTPGIRSLQIHYDDRRLPREQLLAALEDIEASLPATDDIEVASRIVHLPLSWDDPATRLAIRKYTQSVRPDAPWCPSNIEFIRRINGLESVDDVKRIVYDASYLVLGLGDVYLGAPVATPLDPRHRLVTTKYNPARTWTPENAVGIGGAYLCVYGMEGPGGYQFVGRTCQMWNRFHETADFVPGSPWLLRFFDQIRFYEVGADELLAFRAAFPRGRVRLRVEETSFRFADYRAFLDKNAASIDAFRAQQREAFVAERERWASLPPPPDELAVAPPAAEQALPEGAVAVRAAVTGSVWQVAVPTGTRVAAGDRLVDPRDDEDGDARARARRGRGGRRLLRARRARAPRADAGRAARRRLKGLEHAADAAECREAGRRRVRHLEHARPSHREERDRSDRRGRDRAGQQVVLRLCRRPSCPSACRSRTGTASRGRPTIARRRRATRSESRRRARCPPGPGRRPGCRRQTRARSAGPAIRTTRSPLRAR